MSRKKTSVQLQAPVEAVYLLSLAKRARENHRFSQQSLASLGLHEASLPGAVCGVRPQSPWPPPPDRHSVLPGLATKAPRPRAPPHGLGRQVPSGWASLLGHCLQTPTGVTPSSLCASSFPSAVAPHSLLSPVTAPCSQGHPAPAGFFPQAFLQFNSPGMGGSALSSLSPQPPPLPTAPAPEHCFPQPHFHKEAGGSSPFLSFPFKN